MSLSVVSDAHVAPAASLRSLDFVESKQPEDSSPSLKREKLLPSLGDTPDPSAEGILDAPDTDLVVRGAKLPNDAVSEKELNEPECEFSCTTQKMPSANPIEDPADGPNGLQLKASSLPNSPESKTCSSPGSAKVLVFSSVEIQNSSATSIESTDEKTKNSGKTCEVAGDSQGIPTNNSVEVKAKTEETTSEIISKPQTKTSARIAMFEGISKSSNETKKSNKFVIPVRRFSFKKISQIPDGDMKQGPALRRTKKTTKKSKTLKKKGKKSKKSVSKSNSSKSTVKIVESTLVTEKVKEEPAQIQTETIKRVTNATKLLSEKVEEEPAQPQIETLEKVEKVAQLKDFEKCRPLTIKKQTPLLEELFEETKELTIVKMQTPLLGELFEKAEPLAIIEKQNPWLEEFEETKPLNVAKKQTSLPTNSSVRLSHTAENDRIETVALQEESSFSTCEQKNLTIFSEESWPSISDKSIEYRDVVGDFVQGLIDNKNPWKENDHTSKPEPSHHKQIEFESETQSKLVDEILDIYLDDLETVKETTTRERRMIKEKKERMARVEREWKEMESKMMRRIAEKNKFLEQELEIKKHKQDKLHRQKVNEERAKFQKKQVSKPVQQEQKVCDERMRYQMQQVSKPVQCNVAYSGGIKLQYKSDCIETAKRNEEMWGKSAPTYFFVPSCPKLSTKDKMKMKIRNVFNKVEDSKCSTTIQRKCKRSKDKFEHFVEDLKMEARCQKTSTKKRFTRMKWAARELLVRIQL